MKRRIGIILIVCSIVNLIWLTRGLLESEYRYQFEAFSPIISDDPVLTIPSLKISVPVILDVNPWDKSEYQRALSSGVAHATGSALPGDSGTTFLFAHSSASPRELLHTNPAFYRLNRIKSGDEVLISLDNKQFTYQVTGQKIVSPRDVEYLLNTGVDQLILQTCFPIGTDWQRLLVFATPVI
jgi:sortase A